MDKIDVKNKYDEVSVTLEDALKKAQSITFSEEDENAELKVIVETLQTLNNEFKLEIDELEKSSEWDRFCMAFFGETNAGKSTLIESLRIIYDEEKRREELLSQSKEYRVALIDKCVDYNELILKLSEIDEYVNKTMKHRMLKRVLKVAGVFFAGVTMGIIANHFGIVL